MGAPTAVQQADANNTRALMPPNGRTVRSNPTTGTGNVIIPGPPAGFVRRTALGGESAIQGYNNSGGNVDWDLFKGGNRIARQTTHADQQFSGPFFGVIYLAAGEDLTMDFVSGGGGGGIEFSLSYVDIPDSEVVLVDVLLGITPTTIIPAAPAGKVHVFEAGAEETNFAIFNDNAAGTNWRPFISGVQVEPDRAIAAFDSSFSSLLGTGVAIDSSQVLQASADAAAQVRVLAAYRVRDAAA